MTPHPAFDHVHAQRSAVQILSRAVATERIASAYLFDGPSGVGKELAAMALAKAALAGQGEKALHRIDEGAHPDVRIFRPRDDGHRNLRVETLREEILPYAEFAPFEAPMAFLMFSEADVSFPENDPESANALLKTLEEPKAGVTFILLAERPDRLLPTIRSRCQRVRFNPLPLETLIALLQERGVTEGSARAAAALAGGRADRALALSEDGAADALLALAEEVDAAASRGGPGALLDAAERLAKHDDLPLALDGLALYYRDLSRLDLGLPPVAFDGARLERRVSAATAAARTELLREAAADLARNGNKQVVLDAMLYRMRRAR
ncbi:MAG: AAA family ATPase [Myxococcota bacterium]